jgi:hypothetical protein
MCALVQFITVRLLVEFDEYLGDFLRHSELCLFSAGAQMRGAGDEGVLQQRAIFGRGFLAEDIQTSATTLPTLKRPQQSFLVDDAATCTVDDAHATLAFAENIIVQQICKKRIKLDGKGF